MKELLGIILFSYSVLALAMNEIWLEDTDCKILASNGLEVKLNPKGSLTTYICTKDGILINCSNTSKTDTMYGKKTSAISNYNEVIIKEQEAAVWIALSHEGLIILDIKNKRYSASTTSIVQGWLFNKNCAGVIKNY